MEVKPVNIICLYWRGKDRPGWEDTFLGMEYVFKLYKGFERNCTIPFKFFCLIENVPTFTFPGIKFLKLDSPSWRGCLPKYSVFNPSYNFKGRVFVCDLDVVITGNVDDILSYDGEFATRSTFRGKKESGGDLVAFEGGTYQWIWDEFKNETQRVVDFTKGRERWVYRYDRRMRKLKFLQDLFPDQIYSYKNHCNRGRGLPENARMVSCHGNPRPHEIRDDWVKEHWRL